MPHYIIFYMVVLAGNGLDIATKSDEQRKLDCLHSGRNRTTCQRRVCRIQTAGLVHCQGWAGKRLELHNS